MTVSLLRRAWPVLVGSCMLASWPRPTDAAGPKVPEGFEARLVATVPAVLYPCQVATAPEGRLFVAEDPMDQVGPYESFKGRILLFRDGADPVEYAGGFRAIQGMAWHNGELYVCHMPFLTVIKDADGDGKAETRKDLFKDLGPTNNKGLNDHIVSGIQFGMDGWLYISVGDKGVPQATGIDGRTVQLKGGGSLRCRPDGTNIEVVTTGTRNHLEVNLDALDRVFTYDNTDDGDGWWTRVTHHIDGGYYGYPFDYHDRPDRFLPRMAEYGGGSPCGAAFYKDDTWPEKYRGVGFWAEWGKGKVQAFRFKPKGSSFEVDEAIDFAVADGVENFRPIDLAFSDDGKTLYIADWGMGGWGSATEKVGRIWGITYTGKSDPRPRGKDTDSFDLLVKSLDHPAAHERARAQAALVKLGREITPRLTKLLASDSTLSERSMIHALWTLDAIAGGTPEATVPLIERARSGPASVRSEAIRALGLRNVPIAVDVVEEGLKDGSPTLRLQSLIALGRIRDPRAVPAIVPFLTNEDPFIAFAARVALRRIGDWGTLAKRLQAETNPKLRMALLSAMEQQYDAGAVAALMQYELDPERPAPERAKSLQYLADVHRKSKPWDGRWWGTRPSQGKPPAKEIAWEATPAIVETIHRGLSDGEIAVRLAGIDAVLAMNDREALPILRTRFATETNVEARNRLIATLGKLKDAEALPLLTASLRDPKISEADRDSLLAAIEAIGTDAGALALVKLLDGEDLPDDRRPRLIAAIGKFKVASSLPHLLKGLASKNPAIRAATASAVAEFGPGGEVAAKLRPLLNDPSVDVRKAVIAAVAALKDRDSVPTLLSAADKDETKFEASRALASIPDVRALQVYLQGLSDKNPELRQASASAVSAIRDQAAPVLEALATRHELPPSAIPELARVYAGVAAVKRWKIVGPFPIDDPPPFATDAPIDFKASLHGKGGKALAWRDRRAIDDRGQVDLNRVFPNSPDDLAAFAYAEVTAPVARKAAVVVGSDDTLTVWINGKQAFDFSERRGYDPESNRFEVDLVSGVNRILVRCGNRGGPWQFSLGISSTSDYSFLKAPSSGGFDPESFRRAALEGKGNPDHGRALFADLKGLACVKCHAVQGQGGNVGPDLSDIGVKYPREEIIQSILYPSAKIFSGYEVQTFALTDGRVLNGIVKAEADDSFEIRDAEAHTIKIPKGEIDEKKVSNVSLMPNGLAEGLSKTDFSDLVSYLMTLKDKPTATAKP